MFVFIREKWTSGLGRLDLSQDTWWFLEFDDRTPKETSGLRSGQAAARQYNCVKLPAHSFLRDRHPEKENREDAAQVLLTSVPYCNKTRRVQKCNCCYPGLSVTRDRQLL